jgi:hypothetical protein
MLRYVTISRARRKAQVRQSKVPRDVRREVCRNSYFILFFIASPLAEMRITRAGKQQLKHLGTAPTWYLGFASYRLGVQLKPWIMSPPPLCRSCRCKVCTPRGTPIVPLDQAAAQCLLQDLDAFASRDAFPRTYSAARGIGDFEESVQVLPLYATWTGIAAAAGLRVASQACTLRRCSFGTTLDTSWRLLARAA